MPSPLAGLAYAAVKIAGYAAFAHGLNKAMGREVSPFIFGLAKTGLGLVGGVAYLFIVSMTIGSAHVSDAALFSGAFPFRMLAWFVALALFYGFRQRTALMSGVVIVGVAWSYVLDCVMWVIYKILPGMVMPFC
ncbi:MAG TPA: hypothetical protein VIF60_11715 [Burkholderiaceae bacterium]|jgi:hypothetical protein